MFLDATSPACAWQIANYRVPGELLIIALTQTVSQSCYRRHPSLLYAPMKDLLLIRAHLLTTLAKLLGPSGAKFIVPASLLMKHQLLNINSPRLLPLNLPLIHHLLFDF